jgi:proline iminopeptidase
MTMRHSREGHVPVPGARLYFREIGSGIPMLVLHGGPDFNHRYLLPELDGLATHFRLVYYDQRGRGLSSEGVASDDVGIDSEIDDVDRMRAHFGLDRMALLGHSWGGVLAMAYASRRPDRVSHLILLNSAPGSHASFVRFRRGRESTEGETLAKMRTIAATPRYAEGDVATEAEYYRLHFARTLLGSGRLEAVIGRLRPDFKPADIVKARVIEDRLYAQTWRRPEFDVVSPLAEAKVPTLILHGDEDLIPLECANAIADAIPGSRLIVLRNCGHFSYLERPAEVAEAIVDFVGTSGDVMRGPRR